MLKGDYFDELLNYFIDSFSNRPFPPFLLFQKLCGPAVSAYSNRCASTDLRSVMAEKIPKEQERVKNFRKEFGNVKVGEVTVDMVRERCVVIDARSSSP